MATTLPNTGAVIPAMTEAPDQAVNNAAFTAIDTAVGAHLADLATDTDGVHGLKIEKGTWTPVLVGATVIGNNTYTSQYGEYVKENNKVTLFFKLTLSVKDVNMKGALQITGLPFTPAGSYNIFNSISAFNTTTVINNLAGRILVTGIDILQSTPNISFITDTSITNTTVIAGQIIYLTN